MDLIRKVTDLLLEEGISSTYSEDDNSIIFDGVYKNETHILLYNIVYSSNLIAWFQKDDYGHALLRSFNGNLNINYAPESNHTDYVECIYLKIINGSIVFAYREKHTDYICSIHNGKINRERLFFGIKLTVKNDILYFDSVANKKAVKKLKLPELIYGDDLTEIELENQNIKLELNYFVFNRFK